MPNLVLIHRLGGNSQTIWSSPIILWKLRTRKWEVTCQGHPESVKASAKSQVSSLFCAPWWATIVPQRTTHCISRVKRGLPQNCLCSFLLNHGGFIALCFRCTAKWFRLYIHIHTYIYIVCYIYIISLFHYRLLQVNEYNFLSYIVNPCCLAILYIVVYIC